MGLWKKRARRLLDDANYLYVIDRTEQQLAKLLGAVLVVVMVAAAVQLIAQVLVALVNPATPWLGEKLNRVLGDLLNLLIAIEVLQNITSYLRRHVVQIELVLLTAMTAVARKVIVLPAGAESKPQLLAGLGIAVLALAGAFWLVRSLTMQKPPARTGPAIRIQGRDRSPQPGAADPD
ncbi:MAG: phosphate-starvation-inducible PsiE family protein [Cyanobacteriota bacterium]|nr:phosphate-starvation-inducible PsiE family protein [Cyanobacteriota bacterium]